MASSQQQKHLHYNNNTTTVLMIMQQLPYIPRSHIYDRRITTLPRKYNNSMVHHSLPSTSHSSIAIGLSVLVQLVYSCDKQQQQQQQLL
eukprot:6704303-Ditylum_brightwellii.AAC.1